MYTVYIEDNAGNRVAVLTITAKTFSTGSKGFFGVGKGNLEQDDSKGYQIQVQAVKIGSKPGAGADKTTEAQRAALASARKGK